MDDQRHVQVLHDHVDAERERGDAPEEAVGGPVVVVVELFFCFFMCGRATWWIESVWVIL